MTDRLSRDRLADRSGVEPGYIDRLVALGILTGADDGTFAGSTHRIVRLVRSFDGSGITPEDIGEAIHGGQLSLAFLDQPSYGRFAGLSDTTFQEVSERSGIPIDVLTMMREAIVYDTAAPEERIARRRTRGGPLDPALPRTRVRTGGARAPTPRVRREPAQGGRDGVGLLPPS
jgi:hypothetical protein